MKNNISVSAKHSPELNRFRICPNCGNEHFVQHLGRDYCCDHCADEHYNHTRRLNKQAKAMLAEGKSFNQTLEVNPISNAKNLELAFVKNLAILDELELDPLQGSIYNFEELFAKGFTFEAASGRGVLFNIDITENCHFVQYGHYRLYRIHFSEFLIIKLLKSNKND